MPYAFENVSFHESESTYLGVVCVCLEFSIKCLPWALYTLLFETRSLSEIGTHHLTKLAARSYPLPSTGITGTHVGGEDLNSGPCVCAANIAFTEPAPRATVKMFKHFPPTTITQ